MALKPDLEELALYLAYQLVLSWTFSKNLTSQNEERLSSEVEPNKDLIIKVTSDETS